MKTTGPVQDFSGTTSADSSIEAHGDCFPSGRSYLEYQNTSDVDQVFRWGGAASATAGTVYPAGKGFILNGNFVPSNSINIFCTGNKSFNLVVG